LKGELVRFLCPVAYGDLQREERSEELGTYALDCRKAEHDSGSDGE
jgi:hypothetical protein